MTDGQLMESHKYAKRCGKADLRHGRSKMRAVGQARRPNGCHSRKLTMIAPSGEDLRWRSEHASKIGQACGQKGLSKRRSRVGVTAKSRISFSIYSRAWDLPTRSLHLRKANLACSDASQLWGPTIRTRCNAAHGLEMTKNKGVRGKVGQEGFRADLSEPSDVEHALAEAIAKARCIAGLTQEEVAQRMQTTQSNIARLEAGRTIPSTRTLKKFAAAIGARLSITFERTGL